MCEDANITCSTGGTRKTRTGLRVLVLLEADEDAPSDASIKLDKKDSVKLWVASGVSDWGAHAYLLPPGESAWIHRMTNFEGFLCDEKKVPGDRGPFRPWRPIKESGTHKVHFTTIPVPKADTPAVAEAYQIEIGADGKKKEKDVACPYPESSEHGLEKYQGEVRVLRLKASSIHAKRKLRSKFKLLPWQAMIYQNSLDGKIGGLRKKQKARTLTQEDYDLLIELLDEKRGKRMAEWQLGKQPTTFESKLEEFVSGRNSFVQFEASTSGGSLELWSMADKTADRSSGVKPGLTKPGIYLADGTTKKIAIDTRLVERTLEDAVGRVFSHAKPNRARRSEVLKKSSDEVQKLLRGMVGPLGYFLWVGAGHTGSRESVARALEQALGYWSIHVRVKESDLYQKGGGEYVSVLIIRFATGSDAFSEDPLPRHVFYQIRDWWNGLSSREKDGLKEVVRIEVDGFSSRLGLGTSTKGLELNKRLRADRAWKTATCLEMILKEGGVDVKMTDDPPGSASKGGSIPIHWGAKLPANVPPPPDIFKMQVEGAFVDDIPISTVTDEKAVQKVDNDNDPDHRVCLIKFWRKFPEDKEQVLSSEVQVHASHPIHRYKMLQFEDRGPKTEAWSVMFVMPGVFDDR
jgi:hypothetical protein